MSKRIKILFTLIIVILAILSTVYVFWFKEWLAIDKCLDSGGRWNYEKSVCEYSETPTVEGASPAQSQVDLLAAKLEGDEIGRIEIFGMPPEALTRTGITPEVLEKQFVNKLTVHDVRDRAYYTKLIEAIKSTVVQPRSEMEDMHWGIVFYGRDERRVTGLYFDEWGTGGAVDSTPVIFEGHFFKWLDGNFYDCFK